MEKFVNSQELKEAISKASRPSEIFRALRGGLIPSEGESECLINEAVGKYLQRIKEENLWIAPLEFYTRAQEAKKYLVTQKTKYFPELYTNALETYQNLLYSLSSYVWKFPDEIKGKLLKIKALYTQQEACQMKETPVGRILTGVKREAKSRAWFPFIVVGGKEIKANHYISSPELSPRGHQLIVSPLHNENDHSFWGVEISWRLRSNKVYLWEIQYKYESWYFSLVRECEYHQLPTYDEKRQGDLVFSSTPVTIVEDCYQRVEDIPSLIANHKIDKEIEEIWTHKIAGGEIYYLKIKGDISEVIITHSSHPTIKVGIKEGKYLQIKEFPGETHYTPRGISD